MGTYDSTGICEVIGTFILLLIGKKYDSENIGLCRDDEKIKKHMQKIFKKMLVIIKSNMKIVNHLDVTFNLNNGKYKQKICTYNKTKNMHVYSDHSTSIKKHIPKSIAARLSSLSSSK